MHPSQSDISKIYALWKKEFAFDDGGTIDDYFKRNFASEHCYIQKSKEEIIACLCAHPHTMYLQNHAIPVLFISGVITHEKYRKKGYMKALFEDLLTSTKAQYPLFVLQAYNPKIYASLDFKEIYFQKEKNIVISKQKANINEIIDAKDLYECGKIALKKYDGYLDHDLAWYENFLCEAKVQNSKFYGIYEKNQCIGYANITPAYEIEEILCINQTTQDQLLTWLHKKFKIQTYSTPAKTGTCCLLVKLVNAELLSNIMQQKITSLEDIYHKNILYYHYGYW